MLNENIAQNILSEIESDVVLSLEQDVVQIPSPTLKESECAEFLADHMREIGLEVEVQEVTQAGKTSKQPVGRFGNSDNGPTLMFNAHMDHRAVVGEWDRDPFSGHFEDGWIYGRGAQDDKGGIVAAICAVEALIKADIDPIGEIWVCPVMGHKSGSIGSKHLIETGYVPDYCINGENSGNGISNIGIGGVHGQLTARSDPVIPGKEEHANPGLHPIQQVSEVVCRLGPVSQELPSDHWLTFESEPELPGYPQINLHSLESDRDNGIASVRFNVSTVPGMDEETVREDLTAHLSSLEAEIPDLQLQLDIPPETESGVGVKARSVTPPFETPRDSRLVTSAARWHEFVTDSPPEVGGGPRLGTRGDGVHFWEAGSEMIYYGPGDFRIFDRWPTPNEKISLDELVVSTKSYALIAADLVGIQA